MRDLPDMTERRLRAHSAPTLASPPSRMERGAFVARFGGVLEHSAWIAERAYDAGLGPASDTAEGLCAAFVQVFRTSGEEERLGVLRAHPDLAGKLAAARLLTESSAREQAGAGLDAMSQSERTRFRDLNARYTARFGFPFILAVEGQSRDAILAAFEARVANDPRQELETACHEVERIAAFRLASMLPAARAAYQPVVRRHPAMTVISIEQLTRERFAPYGDVLDVEGPDRFPINNGRCERVHALAHVEVAGAAGRAAISILRGEPYALPLELTLLERHPLGSQAFMPLGDNPFLVVVADDENGRPGRIEAFRTAPGQGLNIRRNVWHGILTPLMGQSDFVVVDRIGEGCNLEEFHLPTPVFVVEPAAA